VKYTISEVELDLDTLQTLAELDKTCFPADAQVVFGGTRWWVVECVGEPVAYGGLEHLPEDRGFLCRVGVLRAHRRKGLHRRLIRARERGARALGMKRLVTYTDKDNVSSSNNLIKCGYQLYRPEGEWGALNGLYWWRDL